MAIHIIKEEVLFIKLECPVQVSCVHANSSIQAAMQRVVAALAPAPAPAPAEGFEEQTLEESI